MANRDTRRTPLFDRYKLLDELGSGAMGTVYKAEHKRIGRLVAFKVLPPALRNDAESLDRFDREAKALGRLDHPNIAAVYDADIENGFPYLAMQFIEGQDLERHLQSRSRLPVKEVLHLGRQMAEALRHVHEAGLVHRDVKPSNIIVKPDGRPVLTDFGITFAATMPRITKGVVGTLEYMSPEQIDGADLDARADVYSLGAVLYECLTGRLPFEPAGESLTAQHQLIDRIRSDQPEPVRSLRDDMPAWLARAVMRCLEKKPEDRYKSALALAQALNPDLQISQKRSLSEYLEERGRLPANQVARIGQHIAEALHDRHQRDQHYHYFKPADITLTPGGGAVLNETPDTDADADAAPPPERLGALIYMSPEQLEDKALDGRSDLYSLGVVLYECLTGKVPIEPEGDSLAAQSRLISRILNDTPASPATRFEDVPPWLDAVVMRCLAKTPADRYTDGRELAEALSAPKNTPPAPPPKPRWPKSWRMAGGAVAGLVLIALILFFTLNTDATRPLLDEAQALIEQDRLIEDTTVAYDPAFYEEDPGYAYDKVQQALAMDPDNARAKGLLANIAARLRRKGDRVLAAGNRLEALRIYEQGLTIDSEYPRLLTMRDSVWTAGVPETNDWGMAFIEILPGTFTMGSEYGDSDEKPAGEVEISKPFYLMTTEVTRQQWEDIMSPNPRRLERPNYPINNVSWNTVATFIDSLNARDDGWTYRLPTEAEWEYAARAGTTTRYSWGDWIGLNRANCGGCGSRWDSSGAAPVGSFEANAWGLHDMHGNVWELVQDWYLADYYSQRARRDPQGPENQSNRVLRGGSSYTTNIRVTYRSYYAPSSYHSTVGFRLAREPR